MRLRSVVVLGCAALPAIASAQETGEGTGTEKTAVYLQAGYSPSSWHMGGAALGGVLVRDLTSRLSAEASASYLGRGMGSNGLSASAALLVHLRPTHEKAVPYLAAGGGFLGVALVFFDLRHLGPQHLPGGGPVLVLAPLGLASHDGVGGKVRQPDRARGLVDVLTAGAARPIDILANVFLVDHDVAVVFQLW